MFPNLHWFDADTQNTIITRPDVEDGTFFVQVPRSTTTGQKLVLTNVTNCNPNVRQQIMKDFA